MLIVTCDGEHTTSTALLYKVTQTTRNNVSVTRHASTAVSYLTHVFFKEQEKAVGIK
jgi:hypothetical protein